RYGEAISVVDRRVAVVDEIRDPLEVGDVFCIASWLRCEAGRYGEAIAFAQQGYERILEQMPSSAVHAQAWKALARFRLGDWDQFLEDFELLQAMLGDRREDPPYFVTRPFGPAAMVLDARGNGPAADRLLEVTERIRREGSALQRSHGFLALTAIAYARRGDRERAWAYLSRGGSEGIPGPFVLEASCDVVSELQEWDRADEVLRTVRSAAEGS